MKFQKYLVFVLFESYYSKITDDNSTDNLVLSYSNYYMLYNDIIVKYKIYLHIFSFLNYHP
jgi:hypothetical protein